MADKEDLKERIERNSKSGGQHYPYPIYAELAERFGVMGLVRKYADSLDGKKELMIRQPHDRTFEVAVRWGFEEAGPYTICREAGFWIIGCNTDLATVPQLPIPGTQYGKGRYPSEMYAGELVGRPDAIFGIWGTRTLCVLAFESDTYEEEAFKQKFSTEYIKAKDNMARLREASEQALRNALAFHLRNPRILKNPIQDLWYPVPRQSVRNISTVGSRVPDFLMTSMQFYAYFDWLDREISAEYQDFLESVRAFGLDTRVISFRPLIRFIKDGSARVDSTQARALSNEDAAESQAEVIGGSGAVSAEEEALRHEDMRRAEEEASRIEEERLLEEEEQRRREQEEAVQEEEEPGHDDCRYDELSEEWVTEDGEHCRHVSYD